MVVVGLVVGLVICRRQRRRKHQEQAHHVRGPERDPSQDNINADDDSRFNNKEPFFPSSPQEIQENSLKAEDNPEELLPLSELVRRRLESYSTLTQLPVAPHTTNHQLSPNTSMSASTNYSLCPAPSISSSMSTSSSSRPVPTTNSRYLAQQQQQYRTQQQQEKQQERRQSSTSSSRQNNRHIDDDDDATRRSGEGWEMTTRLSQRRPQDHSDSTRANEERTLTTAEQMEVLHEQVFALNSEMSKLQASLNS